MSYPPFAVLLSLEIYFGFLYLTFPLTRYVVPYNPALLLKYQCHLNVESVHTLKAVKYIFKYITKVGNDFS